MAIWAIGDVQGCCDELEVLLDRIAFNPAHDQLWFTGDLVNRGPRSLDTLRLVKSLGDSAITVLGNHDLHLLALASNTGERIKAQDTLDDILQAPDREELLGWLIRQPLLHHDASLNITMVHAGLPPQWDLLLAQRCAHEVETELRDPTRAKTLFKHMYGDEPSEWNDALLGYARLRFITNCLTRLRICTAAGTVRIKFKSSIKNLPQGMVPWFKAPQRQSTHTRIVFGHWSALGFHDADNVLCLDTGCVWGGTLTAMRLDQRAEPVQVKSISGGVPTTD